MRIVCISDTHERIGRVTVPDGDVLIHAGDLTMRGDLSALSRELEAIAALPHPHKVVIAGNHDWAFQKTPSKALAIVPPGVTYLQDSSVEIQGLKFFGSPWQPWFHDWAFNLPPGEQLAEVWRKIPEDVDVLITHGPPYGIGDFVPRRGEMVGCRELLHRVMKIKPRVHVYGHIHEGYGRRDMADITFVNASVCTGKYYPSNPPIVVDLDL